MGDRTRFRLYVDGRVVDEQWADSDDDARIEEIGLVQRTQAYAAADEGRAWQAEVHTPGNPPGHQYIRFGNSDAGMVHPVQVDDDGVWPDLPSWHPFFQQ